jgi:hypothetical protein
MPDNKKAKEIFADLEKTYNEMVNSLSLEELIAHWRAEIRVFKKAQTHQASWALPAEKLAALEKAVEEFEVIYEAEKAEAEKMPLSWHEARRVRKLFDEADDAQSLPDSRPEH